MWSQIRQKKFPALMVIKLCFNDIIEFWTRRRIFFQYCGHCIPGTLTMWLMSGRLHSFSSIVSCNGLSQKADRLRHWGLSVIIMCLMCIVSWQTFTWCWWLASYCCCYCCCRDVMQSSTCTSSYSRHDTWSRVQQRAVIRLQTSDEAASRALETTKHRQYAHRGRQWISVSSE